MAATNNTLPTVVDFVRDGHDRTHYRRLEGDWAIAVSDVVASTRLVAEGRQRDINFAAAATVAVMSAVASDRPDAAACQFGGDGAIAAIPPDRIPAARAALAALGHWAEHDADVPLRVGLVPVSALLEQGLETWVALHDFGNGNAFGLFLGPGASAAESWVKAGPTWRITPRPGPLPGLGGVSCRWRPVPAHRGVVLCVIVDPAGPADADGLVGVQAAIEAVVSTATASPFGDIERMVPPLFPALSSLRMEMRSQPFGRRWARAVKAVIGAFILGGVHRLGGHLGPLDVDAYRHACAERTDYRKLSGGPRLVLDVTLDEAERIEAILTQAEQAGLIRFGTARADATTMTCLVGDFSADRHIHFVDGADLGFWRAATVLKRKMAAKRVFAEGENPG